MQKIMKKAIIAMLAIVALCTTATAKGPIYTAPVNQTVTLMSEPAGARVYMNGNLICASTPGVAVIPCSGVISRPVQRESLNAAIKRTQYESSIHLVYELDGYVQGEELLTPTVTPQKGSINKNSRFTWPTTVIHRFKRDPRVQKLYDQDPTIVQGEAQNRVSRDKAGQSALERTILRWYFDSDPRGARIFWRVISSIPAEVKNTNETYLMTTPFEETRSFNILGLTYENSRDVTIEIKITKKGYEDQIKRFNVRQAIDQQEISGFFELVKKEE